MKVLIVEDEVRIREGLIKLLEKIGNEYEVVGQANDGSEGLKLCKTLKPDLVITDVQMPNMDGLEMLKAIFSENINKHCRYERCRSTHNEIYRADR